MPDPMREKLGAYLDGELDRRTHSAVQAHLAACPACQAELEELRGLSRLLRATPQPAFTPARDFKARLMLQLPRRPGGAQAPQPRPNGRLLPWLAPALVLAGWVFIQVTLSLSSLVLLAHQANLLDGTVSWAAGDPQQMLWFSAAQATLGGLLNPEGQAGLRVLNDAGLFAQDLLILLLWQVGAALLFWGALALVWQARVKAWWTSLNAG